MSLFDFQILKKKIHSINIYRAGKETKKMGEG